MGVLKRKPYCLGSILKPLISRNSHIEEEPRPSAVATVLATCLGRDRLRHDVTQLLAVWWFSEKLDYHRLMSAILDRLNDDDQAIRTLVEGRSAVGIG